MSPCLTADAECSALSVICAVFCCSEDTGSGIFRRQLGVVAANPLDQGGEDDAGADRQGEDDHRQTDVDQPAPGKLDRPAHAHDEGDHQPVAQAFIALLRESPG